MTKFAGNAAFTAIIANTLARELAEEGELLAAAPLRPHFLGLINEEQSAVGGVHWGLVYLLRLATGDSFCPKEELRDFKWRHPAELRRMSCETWTGLALGLFGA